MTDTTTVHKLHEFVDYPGEKLRRVVRDLEIPTKKDERGWLVIRKADVKPVLSECLRRGGKLKPRPPKP